LDAATSSELTLSRPEFQRRLTGEGAKSSSTFPLTSSADASSHVDEQESVATDHWQVPHA
jgi:hypothetical protein